MPNARRLFLSFLLVTAIACGAACSDDAGAAPDPLPGEKQGSVRYLVYLDGEAPELEAYRKARAAGEDTEEIEKALRSSARKRARKLGRKLKSVGAKVVETWYLTNALTVELPESNVLSLRTLDGVVRIVPDTLYEDTKANAAKAED